MLAYAYFSVCVCVYFNLTWYMRCILPFFHYFSITGTHVMLPFFNYFIVFCVIGEALVLGAYVMDCI